MSEAFFKTYCLPIVLGCLPLALNTWFVTWREQKNVDSRRKFLAVKVAIQLEKVLLGILNSFKVWQRYLLNGGRLPENELVNMRGGYPDDVDWSAIDTNLMNQLLGIENFVEAIEPTIELKVRLSKSEVEGVLIRLELLKSTANKVMGLIGELRSISGSISSIDEFLYLSVLDLEERIAGLRSLMRQNEELAAFESTRT